MLKKAWHDLFSVGTSADFEAKLHTCDDKEFHQLHELIMKKSSTKYSPLSSDDSQAEINVSLKFMVGEATQLRREQSAFKNVIEVRRLGFPNVIMPGDVRCVCVSNPNTIVYLSMVSPMF